jgi:integrase
MSAHAKGPRLYLKRLEGFRPLWIIRDGRKRIATGCGAGEREQAERALADYLAAKYRPPKDRARDPSHVPVADVINLYATEIGPTVASPKELAARLRSLLKFFGSLTLAEVNKSSCRAYTAQRGSVSAARRALSDLSAAIHSHHEAGLCTAVVPVVLPPRSEPRQRWLTRSEAARLIWSAWRYREIQNGKPTDRASRRHVARFVLLGLYTGTRSGAICNAALTPAIGRGFIDLENGVFYRRALGAAETKKRQPTASIAPRLLAHMRRWARLGLSRSSVIEFDGVPVKSVRKAFARAAKDAGLEGVTPHTLRHTAASWAMQKGAPVDLVADALGMTPETLRRVYGHLHPEHHAVVWDAIAGRRR